jgi:CIC family chloride channel protein
VVPPYVLESPWEIPVYGLLGIATALVSVVFIACLDVLERRVAALRLPRVWHPALGGLVLGPMVLVLPELYGVGYGTMDRALAGQLPWPLLLLLVPAKIVATSLTLASGGSGGMFLPALYVGAMAGGAFGTAVHSLFPSWTAAAGAYALVGMAGVLAASLHSPITANLLLIEISGDYRIVLPVMIVTVIATVVGRALEEDSVYTLKLSRRGIGRNRWEERILRGHTVGQVMRPADRSVPEGARLSEVVGRFLEKEASILFVVDGQDRLLGQVSIHDVVACDVRQLDELVLARDLAEPNPLVVGTDETLADCLDRFVLSENEELPVVDAEGRLVGLVSRGDVLRVYSSELLRQEILGVATIEDRDRDRPLIRLAPEHRVEVLPVPPPLVGRTLRDAALRSRCGLTVLAIRPPGGLDLPPDPDRALGPGDALVVVGPVENLQRWVGAGELAAEAEPARPGADPDLPAGRRARAPDGQSLPARRPR